MSHWPRTIAPQTAPGAPAPLRGASILWTRPEEEWQERLARDSEIGQATDAGIKDHGRDARATTSGATPEALADAGAIVIQAPAIEFMDFVARNIEQFLMSLDHLREWRGWLILPSPTAIRHFGRLMQQANLNPAALGGVRIAVIGNGSAAALEALGLAIDFQPPEPNAASLAATLPAAPASGVMIAGSSQSRPELLEELKRRGLRVQFIALYDTRPCVEGLRAIAESLDKHPDTLILAASPSAAEAIADWFDDNARPRPAARWIAIGPTTRARLLDLGVEPCRIAQAASPDAAGIVAAGAALLEARP